jgi:membrane associated rhomboid family serine protease
VDEESEEAAPERAVLELKPPPFAVQALWVGWVCLGVATVGILAPDFAGDSLSPGWGSLLWWLGRGALGLCILAMAAGALWRPPKGGEIEFHPEHLELPRLGSPAGRTRVPYAEVIGVHPWSLFRLRTVVFSSRGRGPRTFKARSFVVPDAIPTFVTRVRQGVAALPDAEARLRLLDRRAAAADAISHGRWWITLGVLALIAAVFLLELRLGALENAELLFALGANHLPFAAGELYRLVTANLLHVNGPHFALNALSLLAFGRIYEPLLGGMRFLVVISASALAGPTASAWSQPEVIGLGASTLGYGLAGCWGYLAIACRDDLPARLHFPLWVWALIVASALGPELLIPRLDHAAHAASFGAGILATAFVTRGAPLAELAHARSRGVRAAAIVLGAAVAAGLAVGVLRAWTALAA